MATHGSPRTPLSSAVFRADCPSGMNVPLERHIHSPPTRTLDRSILRSLDPSIARSLDRSLDRSLTAVHRRRRLSLGRGQVFRHSSLRDVLRRAGLRSVPAPAGLHPALPGVGHRRWGRTPPAHDAQRNHEALVPYVQRGRPPMSGESTVLQLWDMRAGGYCRPH